MTTTRTIPRRERSARIVGKQQYKNTGEHDPGWLEIIETWSKEDYLANMKETISGRTQPNEFHDIEKKVSST